MSRRNECRNGQHQYTYCASEIAGIKRSVCNGCGSVSIDLTAVDTVTKVSERLTSVRRAGLFGGVGETDLLVASGRG
ncbi:MAG: hypothetical protein OEX04_08595 [Acidimicrobiia bacterium]|nr:hypothetical protein [Acidimicrobiia bacterium]MDH4307526.1 hypothetical protein [Acidimicrobiia bacterium]